MDPTTAPAPARLLTATEVGVSIRHFRELRRWSQEQLAEISGLNVRTIQRVEQGESASFDTRRALASAFDCDDVDAFNKHFSVPTPEQLQAAKAEFDREHITLAVTPLKSGRELAALITTCEMDLSEPAFELPSPAAEAFAALIDYYREFRDCADLHSELQKIAVYDELQGQIESLRAMGVSLCHGSRRVRIGMAAAESEPIAATVLYVIAFQLGHEPTQIVTPKDARIG